MHEWKSSRWGEQKLSVVHKASRTAPFHHYYASTWSAQLSRTRRVHIGVFLTFSFKAKGIKEKVMKLI